MIGWARGVTGDSFWKVVNMVNQVIRWDRGVTGDFMVGGEYGGL